MSLTTDPNDPALHDIEPSGMQRKYLVLSADEIRKGYVKPWRNSYRHVGVRPQHPTRPLTADEEARYSQYGYVMYEQYPPGESALVGRFWTPAMLKSGCGTETKMGDQIAATYARDPFFYGGTFCVHCGRHFDLSEFVWLPDGEPMDPNKWSHEERLNVKAAIAGRLADSAGEGQ